jgi:hypothetical protein
MRPNQQEMDMLALGDMVSYGSPKYLSGALWLR